MKGINDLGLLQLNRPSSSIMSERNTDAKRKEDTNQFMCKRSKNGHVDNIRLDFANLMLDFGAEITGRSKEAEDNGDMVIQEERLLVTRRRFIHVKRLARSGGSLRNGAMAEEASLSKPPIAP